MRRWLVALMAALALLLGACTGAGEGGESPEPVAPSEPPENLPSAAPLLEQIAAAISAEDLSQAPISDSTAAQEEWETIFSGMRDVRPQAELGRITYGPEEHRATGYLKLTWEVDVSTWEYEAPIALQIVDEQWHAEWSPSWIHPELDENSRLRLFRELPRRAAITDNAGLALVEQMTLYEVGLDKGAISADQWESSAREVAKLLEIDADAYVQKVNASGERQFVVARVMTREEITPDIAEVPGSHTAETERVVPFDPTFALSLLGTSSEATAEMIEESEGKIWRGDIVGRSGLQARYEDRLRGVPEVRVDKVARPAAEGESAPEVETTALFTQDASVGEPLKTSLDRDLQTKAEAILAPREDLAALVVIRPSDGALLVAANSPAAGEYPQATFGKFAPGSTFKVISSLAMLRDGMSSSSQVQCPAQITVSGQRIGNYSGYPSNMNGTITLTQALAHSCNTAFALAGEKITPEELHAAAESLGVGTDYDAGFTSNFGTVDVSNNAIDRAASMYGQSHITVSPMAMAAVAASVAKGQTVIPWLVEGQQAASTAAPLSAEEAAQLQEMMRAVVSQGSGQVLQGVMEGAKTGTAEFGTAGNYQTHAWMIAWNQDYAVAAFVEVGDSGSGTAAPLIVELLGN